MRLAAGIATRFGRWVVGYGLDYADTFRTLPYIAELRSHVYKK